MNKYRISAGEEVLGREEIIDFLSKIFGPNYYDARIVQETIFDAEPSMIPKNFILARSLNGNLIGLVRIVERNIMLDGAVLTSGGISSVGVKPEWKGQGVASNLMNTAIEVMISRGLDISVLYGRRVLDGFYSRFGYYGVGRYIDLEILSTINSDVAIHTIPFRNEHFEFCMQFYNETYSKLSGSVLRDHSVWKYLYLLLEKGIGGFKALICLEDKKTTGYLVILDNRLIEISIPPPIFSSIPGLLRTLNVQSISIHPRHPFYVYCRTRMNTVLKERFALDGGYMARIINPESLLKKLGPTLATRASVIGMSSEIIRLLNYEVDLRNGNVSKTTKPNDIIFERTETAILLVLGVISPKDIVGIRWANEKPWIPYLFPELYYHTSALDEV